MERTVQCLRTVRFYEIIDKFEVLFWVQYLVFEVQYILVFSPRLSVRESDQEKKTLMLEQTVVVSISINSGRFLTYQIISNQFCIVCAWLNWLWLEIRHICTLQNSGVMTEFSEKRDPKKSYFQPNGLYFGCKIIHLVAILAQNSNS